MRRIILVYLGGGAGAALRALLLGAGTGWDRVIPVSVLAVNLIGAFALGVVYALADEAGLLRAETRLFLAVGVLGGFTTFSTLGWGADVLIGGQRAGAAALYVGVSVLGGFLAVGLGLIAAREAIGLLERAAIGLLRRLDAGGRRRYGHASAGARRDLTSGEAEGREGSAAKRAPTKAGRG